MVEMLKTNLALQHYRLVLRDRFMIFVRTLAHDESVIRTPTRRVFRPSSHPIVTETATLGGRGYPHWTASVHVRYLDLMDLRAHPCIERCLERSSRLEKPTALWRFSNSNE